MKLILENKIIIKRKRRNELFFWAMSLPTLLHVKFFNLNFWTNINIFLIKRLKIVGDPTSIRDKDISLYISGCKS